MLRHQQQLGTPCRISSRPGGYGRSLDPWTGWIGAAILLVGLPMQRGMAAPSTASAATPAPGAYADNCAGCHGDRGKGGMGPALVGAHLSAAAFTKVVRAGKGDMPAMGADAVSDADLATVYQWLTASSQPASQTLPAPQAAPPHPALAASSTAHAASTPPSAGAPPHRSAAHPARSAPASNLPDTSLSSTSYRAMCGSCHGATAHGGFGPALAPSHLSLADFQAVLRSGKGAMPAFGSARLSDGDLHTLFQALGRSSAGAPSPAASNPSGPATAAPAARAASSPPAAGNPYQALCAGCHGVAGAGGTGPALAGRNLSFETIQAVVRSGRGIMPAYSVAMAPDADLHSIATFLSQSNGSTGKPLGRPGPSVVLSHRLVSPDGSDTGIVRSPAFPGYIYPNEARLVWSILIVVYPFVTGLVAGAFILASLLSVFKVKAIQPTYRLALLTSMAFLLVATLPLLAHLGHPERSYEIFTTPHTSSAMAMFGFVYAWYLMVVLCLEIWFEYRADMVRWANESSGFKRLFYRLATFFDDDLSPRSVRMDHKIGYVITLLGIPSAFMLHGYVGFIFGSVKANPYWASPLMPVVFLMSAIVSGIALVLLIYTVTCHLRWKKADIVCLDAVGRYLLYAMIVDFALESLDVIHRTYVAEESLDIITLMIKGKLFLTLIVLQVIVGSLIPMASLASTIMFRISEGARRWLYLIVSILVLQGIFFMRWNVVIGGQLFSKSLIGFTTYKLESAGREGAMVAMVIMALPLVILAVLTAVLPPWDGVHSDGASSNGHNPSANGHSIPGLQSGGDEPEV